MSVARYGLVVATLLLLPARALAESASPEAIERALDERNERAASSLRERDRAQQTERAREAQRLALDTDNRAAFDASEREAVKVDEDNAGRTANRRTAYVWMGVAGAIGAAGYLLPWRAAQSNADAIANGSLATSQDIESTARDVRLFEGLAYGTWALAGVTFVVASIVTLASLPRSADSRTTGAAASRVEFRF